jgi:P-type Mg2+ transporter
MAISAQRERGAPTASWRSLPLKAAATMDCDAVLAELGSTPEGLSADEAGRRLAQVGPNALRSHGARPLAVLARQFRSPLLILLIGTALVSGFVGETTNAVIILSIVGLSVGLGFVNEYRSERAVEELHSQLRHTALVVRDGKAAAIDVTTLVPGDVVELGVGDVVPADVRLLRADDLECDESVLTGEAAAAEKQVEAIESPQSPVALPSCAFMGTVVKEGSGRAVVAETGPATAFGAIAMQLGERPPETAFQIGLRQYSTFLVRVTAVMAVGIFGVNVAIGRDALDSLLFALSIAVGMTPQLLPAIETVSLSTGARRLARRKVLVKRLVAIEDLGDIDVLFTDKTGTLTEGRITFASALDATGAPSDPVLRAGLECNDAVRSDGRIVGGNPLDRALWEASDAARLAPQDVERLAALPFDYERRIATVLVQEDGERRIIVKGAPEEVLARCTVVAPQARAELDRLFEQGSRVVAVATRAADGRTQLTRDDERDLTLAGYLTFVDRPKADAAEALTRLARLSVEVKVITGDNDLVAKKVCEDLGLRVSGAMTGSELEGLDDDELARRLPQTTIFARVTPEQKSRVIRAQRQLGADVGFLGDGVNDAVALHDADAGISVDSATDVAKDAADIVLLDKDLAILADGINEGRRTFANTIKYVLMGTSSNFGNMFSQGAASFFLSFLPMLPKQILLNNLLYDVGEMTIPTDNVDEEQLKRPSHWDIGMIRRFMLTFGPISSIFDFATFAVMLGVFDAGASLFRSGWFVESLATQSLVIFAIRTHRVPFFRSRASRPLTIATLLCVAIGAFLPFSPLADVLGFTALPVGFFAFLGGATVVYLAVVELGKRRFYRGADEGQPLARRHPHPRHHPRQRVHRRASRWSIPGRVRG